MIVRIKNPFKTDKICRFLGQQDNLAELEAVSSFSMPGLNLKPGDKFMTPLEDIIFPVEEEDGYKLAGDTLRIGREEIARLRADNARLREALRGLILSADAQWSEKDGGHDWRESLKAARAALAAKEGEA